MAGLELEIKLAGLGKAADELNRRLAPSLGKLGGAAPGGKDATGDIMKQLGSLLIVGIKTLGIASGIGFVIIALKDLIMPLVDYVSMALQMLFLPLAQIIQSLLRPALVLVIIAVRFWTKLFGSIFKILTSFVLFVMRLFGIDTSAMDMSDLSGDFLKHMTTGLAVFDNIMNTVTDTITGFFDSKALNPETTGKKEDGMFGLLSAATDPLGALFKLLFKTGEEGKKKTPLDWFFGLMFKVGKDLMAPLEWFFGMIFKKEEGEKTSPLDWFLNIVFAPAKAQMTALEWFASVLNWNPANGSNGGSPDGQGGNKPPEKNIFTDAYDNLELVWGEGGIVSQIMDDVGKNVDDALFAEGKGFFAEGGTLENGFNDFANLVNVLLFSDGLGFFAKGGMLENGFKFIITGLDGILFSNPDSLKNKLLQGFTDTVSGLQNVIDIVKKFASAISSLFNAIPRWLLETFLPKTEDVTDAVITPGGKVIHTDPADYLFATKNPGNLARGGGGNTININISSPSFRDDRDLDDLVDKIQRKLEMNLKRGGNYATGY